MDLLDHSIKHPVTVSAGIFLMILFGLIALFSIPIQLTPDAERPVIISASERISPIAWMHVTTLPEYKGDIWNERRFFDETVRPMLERVPGVAKSNLFGGRDTIMEVVLDIEKTASLDITFDEVIQALQKENRNISAGHFDEGKRRYIARTVGQFNTPKDIEDVVIKKTAGAPIKIGDLGFARVGVDDLDRVTMGFFKPSLVMNALREPGANVMTVMEKLRATISTINEQLLLPRNLKMIQVYDETTYIVGVCYSRRDGGEQCNSHYAPDAQ